ncbi:uncharacterized protein LOC143290354 [Babylonia areolata]|uniref:uncharacterized protein LOC143290354 n=1 Tax=Babylonia areolata TaxID=304850 RepID=UPI003FD4BFCD
MATSSAVWRGTGRRGSLSYTTPLLLLLLLLLLPSLLLADRVVRFEQKEPHLEDDLLEILEEEHFMMTSSKESLPARKTLASRARNASNSPLSPQSSSSDKHGGGHVSSFPPYGATSAMPQTQLDGYGGGSKVVGLGEVREGEGEGDDDLLFDVDVDDMTTLEEIRREQEQQLARRIKRAAATEGSGVTEIAGRLYVNISYNSNFNDPATTEYQTLASDADTQITNVLASHNSSFLVNITGFDPVNQSTEATTTTVILFTLSLDVIDVNEAEHMAAARALLTFRTNSFFTGDAPYAVFPDPELERNPGTGVFKAVSCINCELQYGYKECVKDTGSMEWLCQTKSAHYLSFGKNQGDSTLKRNKQRLTEKITVLAGIPVNGALKKKLFLSMNGLISFGKNYKSFSPTPLPVTNYQLLCAYWADLQLPSGDNRSSVWYQVYTKEANMTDKVQSMLSQGGSKVETFLNISTYQPVFMLVATFEDVPPDGAHVNTTERANFQMAVISDGFTTYGLVKYAEGGMTWDGTLGRNVTIGYHSTNIDIDVTSPDQVIGNTNLRGVWFFALSDHMTNPAQSCLNWYHDEIPNVAQYLSDMANLATCPCVRSVASITTTLAQESSTNTVTCFLSVPTTIQNLKAKRCCYRNSDGSFIQTLPDPGTFLLFHPFLNPVGHYNKDSLPKQLCCQNSNLCDYFFEARPISTCQTANITQSMGTGDPHITTLDGRTFSFNGIGEYVYLRFSQPTFELQTRTCAATNKAGNPVAASVFCAFAAKGSSSSFQVEMTRNKTGMNVYVDKQDMTLSFQQEQSFNRTAQGLYVWAKSSTSLGAQFDGGIGITISVKNRQLTIQIDLQLPASHSTPTGLLGNMNGDPTDDFIFRNGTVLPNVTSESDLLRYGKDWAVDDSSSLFTYPEGRGTSFYTNDTFQPLFLDTDSSSQKLEDAKAVCGNDDINCIYDFFVTDDEDLAKGTKTANTQLKDNIAAAANTAPTLTGPLQVHVKLGGTLNMTFAASDADSDDALTYSVLREPAAGFTFDNVSQTATWNVTNKTVSGIEVAAVDSKGAASPSFRVQIVLCDCLEGRGQCSCVGKDTCNTDNLIPTEDEYFLYDTCICEPFYTGENCDSNLDACEGDPCPRLTNCTDLTIEQHKAAGNASLGYTCSDCPGGYTKVEGDDGIACQDVNECLQTPCQQVCTNIVGSYTCSCRSGYRVDSDNVSSCLDIDECQANTHDCEQQCINVDGGFTCGCFSGFSLSATDPKQCVQDETATNPCAPLNCSYACSNETGSYQCACPSGFTVASDQISCEDIDECKLNQCSQKCDNNNGSYVCSCYSGFYLDADKVSCKDCPANQFGESCNQTCDCRGRGTCDKVRGCVCDAGWSDVTCSSDVNECEMDANLCPIDQICRNNPGSFACVCPEGFKKVDGTCIDIDECAPGSENNCGHVCNNVQGSYTCSCYEGYQYNATTDTCDDIDECATNSANCEYGCENFEGSANCLCGSGFVLDDDRRSCVKEQDPCEALDSSKSCQYACRVVSDQAQCYCKNGYSLVDDVNCQDVDECTDGTHQCGGQCDNIPGSYQCSCSVGFKLENDQRTCVACDQNHWGVECRNACDCNPLGVDHCDPRTGCDCLDGWRGIHCETDINECAREDVCTHRPNSECVNTAGSFLCQCRAGYSLKGDVCEDTDECKETPSPCDQHCSNTNGSYQCSCNEGFNSEGSSCVDVNECLANPCDQICRNTQGGYSCECEEGFLLNATNRHTCYVQTECSSSNSCEEGCVYKDGQNVCFCPPGYVVNATDTDKCQDIDECVPGKNPCVNGNCANHPGTFACTCDSGTYLLADKITCQACDQGTFGLNCESKCTCSKETTQSCDRVTGNCMCIEGWEGGDCSTDIDMCSRNDSLCADVANSNCSDPAGFYRCQCLKGFYKSGDQCLPCDRYHYGTECSEKCSCDRANTADCNDTNGVCTCKPEWKGQNCTEDVDECSSPDSHTCSADKHEQCHNQDGSYACNCVDGYYRPSPVDNCTDINECQRTNRCNSTTENCVNIAGSYNCECAAGHINATGTCESAIVVVPFIMILNLTPTENLTDPTTSYYIKLKRDIELLLTGVYQKAVGSAVIGVVVTKLSKGSLIVNSDVQVDGNQTDNPEAVVSKGIKTLLTETLAIDGKNVTVATINVNNQTFNADSSACDILQAYTPCNGSDICVVGADGEPQCISPEEENLDLVIGLAVGIPLAVLAVIVIVIVICIHIRRRHHGSSFDEADSDQSGSIFAGKLATRYNWGPPRGPYAYMGQDNRSVSSDNSDGQLGGGAKGAAGRGRSDFQDSAWYDRAAHPAAATPVSGRTAQSAERSGADLNNSSWDYIFNMLGPYNQTQPFEIQRPHVTPNPDPFMKDGATRPDTMA